MLTVIAVILDGSHVVRLGGSTWEDADPRVVAAIEQMARGITFNAKPNTGNSEYEPPSLTWDCPAGKKLICSPGALNSDGTDTTKCICAPHSP